MKKFNELSKLEQKFYTLFELAPKVKKGETYFSSNLRFCECVADEDLYSELYDKDILRLEDVLGDFSIIRTAAEQDVRLYLYKTAHWDSCLFPERKDALLDLLTKNVDKYKLQVQGIWG